MLLSVVAQYADCILIMLCTGCIIFNIAKFSLVKGNWIEMQHITS